MPALDGRLRGPAEKTILEARAVAEEAARVALDTLAVNRDAPFATMGQAGRDLRKALRARARALGNGVLADGLSLLIQEIAYEQWHRMLFARFLAENDLLMHPAGLPVTLEECAELAAEEGESDGWGVAAKYAAAMLPGIFRNDDPAVRVRLAPEGRAGLERRLRELPRPLFTADDGLGWVYQFWQSARKDEVNASGRKVVGADLAPVTQLFTEDYLVRFLLENTLGSWWAARHPESALVQEFVYLRRREDGSPAAGAFSRWPDRSGLLSVMDPCCGSGHFLEAAFRLLLRMRMEEEGLDAATAGDAVLRENLFGLELDPRCVQIAAFQLALSAWRTGGYRPLPTLNLACSGVAVQGHLDEWLALARGDANLELTLRSLHQIFRQAPELGSLINPLHADLDTRLFGVTYEDVVPLLETALRREGEDPAAAVFGASAEGAARAARLLGGTYTLVATNVPYLVNRKQGPVLREFIDRYHRDARGDLATAFVERSSAMLVAGGTHALVTPQNWLFLGTYAAFRKHLLRESTLHCLAVLGPGAFETISGEVVKPVLTIVSNSRPPDGHKFVGLDVSGCSSAGEKAQALIEYELVDVPQAAQLQHPDARITLGILEGGERLERYAVCLAGILNGDSPRFQRFFWEVRDRRDQWVFQQSTVERTQPYAGRERVILFDERGGHLREEAWIRRERLHDSDRRGNQAWGKRGIVVSQMGDFPVTLYTGEKFDSNAAVILPKDPAVLPALWAYCSSPDFRAAVRSIDRKMNVTNATFAKVPFDLPRWQAEAERAGPLPEPHSQDPTQWIFAGYPVGSTEPLQVAVARLLGYRWPHQRADQLDSCADEDGLVCLSPLAGEPAAAERLRVLLAVAYGDCWSATQQEALLAQVGYGGRTLEAWLRDGFFEQHCRLFRNRPFIWQVWDGRPDGFSALVNYHRFDGALLDKLTYTYLGAWVSQQRAAAERGEAGAEGRLVAALELQRKLKLIREGEPPYDIYVRWKPLHRQPMGWEPDLDDGVRLNIRPFVEAGVLRRRFNINWKNDRGTDADGSDRVNDRHLSLEGKRRARAAAGVLV